MDPPEKVNILLVDDQPSRLLTYETVLADLGQNLIRAGSGSEALRQLMQQEFAVILLDVNMPGMDGFETASLIHEHPRYEKTPIIFVTAVHVTDVDRLRGYKLGAVDYVYIPVVPEILRSKVAVLVELYRNRRELEELNRTLERANADLVEANAVLRSQGKLELLRLNQSLEQANERLEEANAALQAEIRIRQQAEEALQEADRRKDQFLATLAHELRNPLNPILHAVEILRLTGPASSEVVWARDVIRRQTEHLTRLVDDLLDLGRITRDKLELRRERVELSKVVREAVDSCRPLVESLGHELAVEIPAEPVVLDADAVRLAQVLTNLLHNALKYTPRGGRIVLAAERTGDGMTEPEEVVVHVRDSGMGIPPDKLPRLFDTFYQVDTSVERSHGGLGLGLTLVRRLVEMHGGRVEARSDGVGKGSEFIVRLPLPVEMPQEPRPQRLPAAAPARAAVHRVLVVDDNLDSANSLAMMLRLTGHEVQTASDGLEAIEAAERFRPEAVLLDIGMPKVSGLEVARRIREQSWGRDMILIAQTGWGQEEDRHRSRDAGFDAHVVKPVDPAALIELMSGLADGERERLGPREPARSYRAGPDPRARTANG